jgi:hypothetical protein
MKVFDIEANGLLEEATSIHCLCLKNLETQEEISLSGKLLNKKEILHHLNGGIAGHNIIGYDIPLLKKFYGFSLIDILGRDAINDTFIMSKTLYPDRPMPKGCPESAVNPITGHSKKIGPHGLEAWGWRVGIRKIEIHDWRFFSPEILKRCMFDVNINEKVYYELLKEADL